VLVELGEASRDAQNAAARPVDLGSGTATELPYHQQLELGLVVQEPFQVVEPLADDVRVGGALVLDDYRTAVLVDAQGVDTAAMLATGAVLGAEEAHTE